DQIGAVPQPCEQGAHWTCFALLSDAAASGAGSAQRVQEGEAHVAATGSQDERLAAALAARPALDLAVLLALHAARRTERRAKRLELTAGHGGEHLQVLDQQVHDAHQPLDPRTGLIPGV